MSKTDIVPTLDFEARDAENHLAAIKTRSALLEEFGKTFLSGIYLKNPPITGSFGSAVIWVKEGAVLVAQEPYMIAGEREEDWGELVNKARKDNKLEPSTGAWNLSTFSVAKKTPGKYQRVQDFRPLNDATIKDGHPLPRIVELLHTRGKKQVVVQTGLVDGFHQMPLKLDPPPIYHMPTPRRTMQWNVLAHGMENASAQFKGMMECVLCDIPNAHPYIDDDVVGLHGGIWDLDYQRVSQVILRDYGGKSPF